MRRSRTYDVIGDDDLKAAIGRAAAAARPWGRETSLEDRVAAIRKVAALHSERRQELAEIIVREMGKPVQEALGEVDFAAAIYEYYADNAVDLLKDEPIETARRRGLGGHPPHPRRPAARDHAVELPLLPGRSLRRPEPADRQHDPAQARAAVPRVLGGDGADLPRRRHPAGRLHQHLRDQRADRVGDRRPARAGRLADRLRPRRRRRRADRRPPPQEGRARAGRRRPLPRARQRRPRLGRRGRRRRPAWATAARPATRRSGSSCSTSTTTRSSRS